MDVFTPAQRSAVMSRVRGKDTKPEMAVRRMVHSMGGVAMATPKKTMVTLSSPAISAAP